MMIMARMLLNRRFFFCGLRRAHDDIVFHVSKSRSGGVTARELGVAQINGRGPRVKV
jgi:hypothetical protein